LKVDLFQSNNSPKKIIHTIAEPLCILNSPNML
jgi:hypothetical protein